MFAQHAWRTTTCNWHRYVVLQHTFVSVAMCGYIASGKRDTHPHSLRTVVRAILPVIQQLATRTSHVVILHTFAWAHSDVYIRNIVAARHWTHQRWTWSTLVLFGWMLYVLTTHRQRIERMCTPTKGKRGNTPRHSSFVRFSAARVRECLVKQFFFRIAIFHAPCGVFMKHTLYRINNVCEHCRRLWWNQLSSVHHQVFANDYAFLMMSCTWESCQHSICDCMFIWFISESCRFWQALIYKVHF